MSLENKVVVITGASSGIGEATARMLAEGGAKVVLGARRETKLAKIVEEIKNKGGQATYAVTDVTKASDVKDLVTLAQETFGGIDVITTSSVAGIKSFPDAGVYGATKFAVRNLMEVLRTESAMEKTNIRTSTLYPAAINTELLNTITDEETLSGMSSFYKQVGIDPVAIARVVKFAIDQPEEVNVNEFTIYPTAQA